MPTSALALHWQPHLGAIDAGLGMDLTVRLRASELAQGALFAADGAGERERIVLLHTLEHERGDWIRWAGARDRLHELAEGFGGGRSTGTAARLEPVLALSSWRDDDQIRATVWATRWHEAHRANPIPRTIPTRTRTTSQSGPQGEGDLP